MTYIIIGLILLAGLCGLLDLSGRERAAGIGVLLLAVALLISRL